MYIMFTLARFNAQHAYINDYKRITMMEKNGTRTKIVRVVVEAVIIFDDFYDLTAWHYE